MTSDDRLPKSELVLLWLMVAAAMSVIEWGRLDETFKSTDNLMRLVELREFLAGAPWSDLHEPRLAPPGGYDTHWSRLIDAGLAGVVLVLRQLVAPDLAERLTRCIWPLLLAGPAIAAATAIAVRLGGTGAGRATLISALMTVAMLPMFRPGEIDHHNAQVMLSLMLIACALWHERRGMGAAAGLCGGLLLSIGLEAAHVPLAVGVTLGILAVRDPAWSRPARDFALALGLSTFDLWLLVTPSASRFTPACDALAVNSATAVAVAGLMLGAFATRFPAWAPRGRLLALLIAGAAAAAVFTAFEPRCLKGPFGLIDRSVFALWLDQVDEMQGLPSLFRSMGAGAVVYVAFPLAAIASVILVLRNGLSTPLAWALVAAFAISAAIMAGQIRMMIYVMWLGLPFIGVAAHLLTRHTQRVAAFRLAAVGLMSPPIITFLAGTAASLLSGPASQAHAAGKSRVEAIYTCFRPENFRALAALPRGLVIGPLDLGPSVLAHTGHSVVAAPYHRAYEAVRFNQETMSGPSTAADARVRGRGVDYVITCRGYPAGEGAGTFHAALLAGTPGAWLAPVATPEGDLIRIWRVLR